LSFRNLTASETEGITPVLPDFLAKTYQEVIRYCQLRKLGYLSAIGTGRQLNSVFNLPKSNYEEEVFQVFSGIFKLPSYIRIEVDEYELERLVSCRYEERFGEPPLKVESARYPGVIDIIIYINEITEEKRKFASQISEKLDDDGLNNIVLVREPE